MKTIFSPVALFFLLLCNLLFCAARPAAAQDERTFKRLVTALCTSAMEGRGYTEKGGARAARFISTHFSNAGLRPVLPDSTFFQSYAFPVNTFPGAMNVSIGKKELTPGEHFIVNSASGSFASSRSKVETLRLKGVKDSVAWMKVWRTIRPQNTYLLRDADTLLRYMGWNSYHLVEKLPKACYILPQKGKMIWTVSDEQTAATVLQIEDSVLPRRVRRAAVAVEAKMQPRFITQNVMAMVPGTAVPDSFLVFTAHYDHLGKMGREAVFPGASDNASGTAMMLWLAQYFAARPQRYSILFIAFSGEEAGLLGSSYYVRNPVVPLEKMRFLINLDIMGDASDGVTVVNATEHPAQFSLLQKTNDKGSYLPKIVSRGKAANSDHYPFSERGVPAIFIYSNGGKGYYHDVLDKAAALTYTLIPEVARLLQDFVPKLCGAGR